MAKIVLSADAPEDATSFYFGNAVVELDATTKSFDTDDAVLIAEANAHPWLEVDYTKPSKRKAAAPTPTPTTEDKG